MNKLHWILISLVLMIVSLGCGLANNLQVAVTGTDKEPTVQNRRVTQDTLARTNNTQTCMHPAGWQAYQVTEGEFAEGIAARVGTTVDNLLGGNCLVHPQELVAGRVIYVPVPQQNASPQTVLPLGVSAFVVEPVMAQPGEAIRVYWQGQGPVQTVRIGWVFNGVFVEEIRSLPISGIAELTVPDDGRGQITYMIRVSDGRPQEISAEATIRVACRESWFFNPVPASCGSAPLVTEFVEQHFEHGTIVYIPALGVHYMMVAGQEAILLDDDFVPGMPAQNGAVDVPVGYNPTQGPINYVWSNEGVRVALGHAVNDAVSYPGMLQRSVDPAGEVIYFSASSGHVYRVGTGLVWGVIIPE
jgi:LysM repeat protein